MKIAFIKRNFSYHGGAEKYLSTLINSLKKKGHEIHIFSNEWIKDKEIVYHRIKIIPLGSFLKTYSFNYNLKVNLHEFDSVISFERTTKQNIYRAGEGCHVRWLELRSMIEPLYRKISFKINPLHLYYLKIEKEIFQKTPLIVTNSRMVKDDILKYYRINPDKISVIYNGVDLIKFSVENRHHGIKLREKFNISKKKKIILFVGSGFKRKGLDILIQALQYLKSDYLLFIVGKGDFSPYLNMAKNLKVEDKILFLGVSREIEKIYSAADVFVLPTLYDPFSNATLEAMASGLCVITTKNNGAAEIIEDGKEGFILENLFDKIEIAEKIELALKNSEVMGYDARKKSENYSIDSQAEQFLSIILNFKNREGYGK